MDLFQFVFGSHPTPLEVISTAPDGVVWRTIRAKPGLIVTAQLAKRRGLLRSAYGNMRFRPGSDYIVERVDGERSVVSRGVFEKTYSKRSDGSWEKRTDVVYRYFTLARAVLIATPEGLERADAGDWIVQGVNHELWPVKLERAAQIYEPTGESPAGEPAREAAAKNGETIST